MLSLFFFVAAMLLICFFARYDIDIMPYYLRCLLLICLLFRHADIITLMLIFTPYHITLFAMLRRIRAMMLYAPLLHAAYAPPRFRLRHITPLIATPALMPYALAAAIIDAIISYFRCHVAA